jgi:hypothetical protein
LIPKLLHNPTIPLVGLIVAIVLFPLAAWMDFTLLINRELSGQAGLLNQMLTESRQLYNETLGAGLADQDMETAKVDLRTHRFGSMSFMGEPTRVSLFDHVDKPFGTFQVPATFTIQLARRTDCADAKCGVCLHFGLPFQHAPGRGADADTASHSPRDARPAGAGAEGGNGIAFSPQPDALFADRDERKLRAVSQYARGEHEEGLEDGGCARASSGVAPAG